MSIAAPPGMKNTVSLAEAVGIFLVTGAVTALPACGANADTASEASTENAVSVSDGGGAPAVVSGCSDGMCQILSGTFQMGSAGGESDELPVHPVTVSAFMMDEFEVTADQYAKCVTAGGCTAADTSAFCNAGVVERGNHPINCVDWNQADTYCKWANKRLPTEAEWEYAARSSDGREYPWGTTAPEDKLCWSGKKEQVSTCAVGSHPSGKSPFGVQDMSGNVQEWVSGVYSPGYFSAPNSSVRVSRGGHWFFGDPSAFRSANREGVAPTMRSYILGFRCAK